MTKKRILAVLVCAMVFAGVGFVACNEDPTEESVVIKKNATVEEDLVIARCPKGSKDVELLFNVDSVALHLEQVATKELLTDVIVEEIYILDEDPTDLNNPGYLVCSSFFSTRGESDKMAIEITKFENEKTGDIQYQFGLGGRVKAKCKGRNCDGCRFDIQNGMIIGCTPCANPGGKCRSKVSFDSGITSDMLFDVISEFRTL